NQQLAELLRGPLTTWRLRPSQIRASTTAEAVLLGLSVTDGNLFRPTSLPRLSGGVEGVTFPMGGQGPGNFPTLPPVGGGTWRPTESSPLSSVDSLDLSLIRDRAQCLVHESFIDDVVARSGLAGLEIPDSALAKLLSAETDRSSGAAAQLGTIVL